MGRSRRALILLAALALASPANAQTTEHVELRGETQALDRGRLDDLVALELGATRVTRIVVDVSRGRAELDVEVAAEHRKASVTIASVEPERALALFIAEIARGTIAPERTEPATPAAAVPAVPTPRDTTTPALPPAPLRFSFLGAMGARVTTARGHVMPSPHVEIGVRRDNAFRVGGTLRYAYATADDRLGTVEAHLVAGGVAGSGTLVSGSGLALVTGPRLELGAAFGRGEGTNADKATAWTVAGAWALELHLVFDGATAFVAAEAGSFFRGVELHADDRSVLQLTGPWLGFALGATL